MWNSKCPPGTAAQVVLDSYSYVLVQQDILQMAVNGLVYATELKLNSYESLVNSCYQRCRLQTLESASLDVVQRRAVQSTRTEQSLYRILIRSRFELHCSLSSSTYQIDYRYENASTSVRLQSQKSIVLKRGVRQGNFISPKLFKATHQQAVSFSWTGWRVHHLPFVCCRRYSNACVFHA